MSAGDDAYIAGSRRAHEDVMRLFDAGWSLEEIFNEMRGRVEQESRPGPYRDGLSFGLELGLWQCRGYLDGYADAPKAAPPADLLGVYLEQYQHGVLKRRDTIARLDALREVAEKAPTRGQGGSGVQLRLVPGGLSQTAPDGNGRRKKGSK